MTNNPFDIDKKTADNTNKKEKVNYKEQNQQSSYSTNASNKITPEEFEEIVDKVKSGAKITTTTTKRTTKLSMEEGEEFLKKLNLDEEDVEMLKTSKKIGPITMNKKVTVKTNVLSDGEIPQELEEKLKKAMEENDNIKVTKKQKNSGGLILAIIMVVFFTIIIMMLS